MLHLIRNDVFKGLPPFPLALTELYLGCCQLIHVAQDLKWW